MGHRWHAPTALGRSERRRFCGDGSSDGESIGTSAGRIAGVARADRGLCLLRHAPAQPRACRIRGGGRPRARRIRRGADQHGRHGRGAARLQCVAGRGDAPRLAGGGAMLLAIGERAHHCPLATVKTGRRRSHRVAAWCARTAPCECRPLWRAARTLHSHFIIRSGRVAGAGQRDATGASRCARGCRHLRPSHTVRRAQHGWWGAWGAIFVACRRDRPTLTAPAPATHQPPRRATNAASSAIASAPSGPWHATNAAHAQARTSTT